jgi:hypothetical protein
VGCTWDRLLERSLAGNQSCKEWKNDSESETYSVEVLKQTMSA